MKNILLSAVFVSFAAVLAGCNEERFMVPKPAPQVFEQMTPSAAEEVALAEEVTAKRLAYRKELEKIKSYYEQSGNQLKIEWVNRELASIDAAPRYSYILQAEVAGDKLVAKDSIPKADILYKEALDIYNRTDVIFPIPLFVKHDDLALQHPTLYVSKKKLQRALNKCNELIKEYPASDKIDDAAYLAGEIHEWFKDYSIAALYYKRAFQWDSQTPYPARYRAANLLDYQLYERDKALLLYRESLQKEKEYLNSDTVTLIEQRIAELTVEPKSESIK
jgi:tetratricopeptide (TPR) repeat protein